MKDARYTPLCDGAGRVPKPGDCPSCAALQGAIKADKERRS